MLNLFIPILIKFKPKINLTLGGSSVYIRDPGKVVYLKIKNTLKVNCLRNAKIYL